MTVLQKKCLVPSEIDQKPQLSIYADQSIDQLLNGIQVERAVKLGRSSDDAVPEHQRGKVSTIYPQRDQFWDDGRTNGARVNAKPATGWHYFLYDAAQR